MSEIEKEKKIIIKHRVDDECCGHGEHKEKHHHNKHHHHPKHRMHKMRVMMDNEVVETKLFTDKEKMVEFVNAKGETSNTFDIFKIEDGLYKVVVMSSKKCCE